MMTGHKNQLEHIREILGGASVSKEVISACRFIDRQLDNETNAADELTEMLDVAVSRAADELGMTTAEAVGCLLMVAMKTANDAVVVMCEA